MRKSKGTSLSDWRVELKAEMVLRWRCDISLVLDNSWNEYYERDFSPKETLVDVEKESKQK